MQILPGERPVSLQLFGSDPEIMGEIAAQIQERPFDVLDINMGCPMSKIVNNGDGAALMHLGAMAVIGANKTKNLIHIVINNGAHETVGGMPTVSQALKLTEIATACGYPYAVKVNSYEELDKELAKAKNSDVLTFIEATCSIGSRADLGRPTTTALDNKNSFVEFLKGI